MANTKERSRSAKKPTKASKMTKAGSRISRPKPGKQPGKAGVVRKSTLKREGSRSSFKAIPVGQHLSSSEEIQIIKQGAPVSLAKQLQTEVGLTQRDLSRVLGIAHRTFVERMKQAHLGEDESDRVLRLKRIYEQAVDTFEGNKDAAIQWLRTPNRALNGQIPFDLLSTGTGARAVDKVLLRMEHSIYS